MAENNVGVAETMIGAMAQAVSKLASRKMGIAIVGMYFLKEMVAPAWMIFGLALGAMLAQLVLEMTERIWLKTDLPENNNGEKTPEVIGGNPA